MKKILLLSFLMFGIVAIGNLYAQQGRSVTGTVTDEEGEALPGVNVVIKGTTTGTITDVDGKYKLDIPANETAAGTALEFSFIGLSPQTLTVGQRSVINVTMATDVTQLTEVVVVGFGTESKRNLTSSVTSIGGEKLAESPATTFQGALQGRAAGVSITGGSGALGAQNAIRIRGASSINASNQPLIVVDGIPISVDNGAETDIIGGSGFGGQGTTALANLNPNDIESVEVLKDAGASAIYGARGANGVILITTKRGKAGKTKVNLNYYAGTSEPTATLDMMSGPEYQRVQNYGRLQTSGLDWFDPNNTTATGALRFNENPNESVSTDHIDLVTDPAFLQEFSANASGGSEKTQFYTGLTYRDEDGWIRETNFKRFSGRLNINHKISDKVSLDFRINPSRTVNKRQAEDNAIASPFTNGALSRPDLPGRNPDGTPFLGNLFGGSPLGNLENQTRILTTNQVFTNVNLRYQILPGLSFRTEFGSDFLTNREVDRTLADHTDTGAQNGEGLVNTAEILNINWNNIVNYDFSFDEHNFSVLGGITYQDSESKTSDVSGNTFASAQLRNLASAAEITAGTSTGTEFTFLSYLAKVTYNYDNKYLFSVTGNYNGSSRFGVNNRFGFFPAVSAGWVLSDEEFLKSSNVVNFLKLRASYGSTGNAEISNFASRGLVGFGRDYNAVPGFEQVSLQNDDLSWERTNQLDIAFDFGFLNNRFNGSVGYYDKRTNDLLLDVPLPREAGIETLPISSLTSNIGGLTNSGFELELNAEIFRGDFNWTASFNIATLNNEITKLVDNDGDGKDDDIITAPFVHRVGEAVGSFFLVKYAGVDPETGDALFENADGEVSNVFSSSDAQIVGDPFPDFYGGFTNNLSYKGIDLNIFFQYNVGNDVYRSESEFTEVSGSSGFNQARSQLNAWTPENRNTDIPEIRRGAANGNQESSRYLEDGSYLRLKSISLGYTLPQSLTKGTEVRVYAQGFNLLTFTDYSGPDPEVSRNDANGAFQGETFFSRPQSKQITFGVNIGL